MAVFMVRWEVPIEAETPLQAAQEAFKTVQEPGTDCQGFDVFEEEADKHWFIDLQEPENNSQLA